jgi:hypothetical protein
MARARRYPVCVCHTAQAARINLNRVTVVSVERITIITPHSSFLSILATMFARVATGENIAHLDVVCLDHTITLSPPQLGDIILVPHSLSCVPYSLIVVRPDHIIIPTSSASPSHLCHPDLARRCPPNLAFNGRIVIPTAHTPLQHKRNGMTHQMLMCYNFSTHLSMIWISFLEKVRNFYAK